MTVGKTAVALWLSSRSFPPCSCNFIAKSVEWIIYVSIAEGVTQSPRHIIKCARLVVTPSLMVVTPFVILYRAVWYCYG